MRKKLCLDHKQAFKNFNVNDTAAVMRKNCILAKKLELQEFEEALSWLRARTKTWVMITYLNYSDNIFKLKKRHRKMWEDEQAGVNELFLNQGELSNKKLEMALLVKGDPNFE